MLKTWKKIHFYFEKVFPILNDLSENSRKIWYYAFTEMMNNAIEHAKGKKNLL